MSEKAVWGWTTVFCTEPQATGRFYSAFGLPVRVVDDDFVEVSAVGGPTLRLVKASTPSRTYLGIYVIDFSPVKTRLTELGLRWVHHRPPSMHCWDPDGNDMYALIARPGRRPQRLVIVQFRVTDPKRTMNWFRHGLGMRVSDASNIIVAIGGPADGEPEDVWVHFRDQQPSLLLYPPQRGRVAETAMGIEVSDLAAITDRLDAVEWDYELKGPATLVTRSPDGWPIYLTPFSEPAGINRN